MQANNLMHLFSNESIAHLGPVAGLLTDRYGAKLITMIGGLIGSLGLVLTSFAVNAYQLLVTFGLVTGELIFFIPGIKGSYLPLCKTTL